MIDVREITAELRLPNFILRYLASLIHQREINAALREFGQLRGADFVRAALNYFDVRLRAHGTEHLAGLERPVLISNHPLGGLDGLALIFLLFTYFSEVRLMVNDLLMNIHQMEELFLPVSKEMDGGMSNYRHGERYRELFSGNAAILHFPAGKCSRRIGGRVQDLPWNKSYVRLCRENSRPIVPCRFFGENSRRFYTIANLRRWFRIPFNVEMLFLVDEMFRKQGQTLEIRIGTPIPAAELCASDNAGNTIRNSASINADINAEIRRRVYALKQASTPASGARQRQHPTAAPPPRQHPTSGAPMILPKILKWEFWPSWIMYLPVAVWLIAQGLRKGSLLHFLSANPGLRFGGLLEYSKSAMFEGIPARYLPKTHYFKELPGSGSGNSGSGSGADEIEGIMKKLGLAYPVFLKPDMGERGMGVERVHGRSEVLRYLRAYHEAAGMKSSLQSPLQFSMGPAIILQENISGGEEYGVMVVKNPVSGEPRITSLVIKEPLSVQGDGVSTLAQLIRRGARARYHRRRLEKLHRFNLHEILSAGEERVLMDIGNHARGVTFRNGNHLISPALLKVFAPLADCIPEFYLGRFDVKTRNIRALERGEFRIIEINGVNSEPAHIYELDLFTAWVHLLRHWRMVSAISSLNIERGFRPESSARLLRALRQHALRKKYFRE